MAKIMKSLHILLLLFTCVVHAANATEKIYNVGVIPGEPFVIDKKHGKYEGIAIDLWRYIAEEEHYSYKFTLLNKNVNSDLASLQKGKIDLIIGPISDTYERHKLADLTSPYFINQIGIIINPQKISHWESLKSALMYLLSPLLAGFVLLFLLYVHIYWFLDKKYNPDLPQTYLAGINYTLWTHLLKKGFNHVPRTISARVIALIWLIAVAFMISSLTAILSSTFMTLTKNEQSKIITHADINSNTTLAFIKGTKPINLLRRYNPKIILVPNIEAGLDLLHEGKVDGVIYDYALAEYLIDNMQSTNHIYKHFRLSPVILENDLYVFALPKNSKLYNSIDTLLIKFRFAGITRTICEKYLEFSNVIDCEF